MIGLTKVGLAFRSQSWQDAGTLGLSPTQGQILSLLQTCGLTGMRLSVEDSSLKLNSKGSREDELLILFPAKMGPVFYAQIIHSCQQAGFRCYTFLLLSSTHA